MALFRILPQYLLAVFCLGFSLSGWSVGISDAELHSHLGEPLKAQLKLTDTGNLSKDQIIVRMAPPAIFEKMGIERHHNLLPIRFDVDDHHNISVRTQKPINEPYLNFIIEVKWPEGQLYREYKLFLDPV